MAHWRKASGLQLFHAAGPDAYEVLNVPETATASEVRKKFWRVSLLVHPDKCRHECAANAFDAVKKAAEALLDAGTRHGIDERKRKEANTQLDQQVAAELEKERQWRVAQGTATAEDLRSGCLWGFRIDTSFSMHSDSLHAYLPGAVQDTLPSVGYMQWELVFCNTILMSLCLDEVPSSSPSRLRAVAGVQWMHKKSVTNG